VQITLNGRPAGVKIAPANGRVTFRITVLALDRVDVDDVVPGLCGRNTMTGTGQGGSVTALFNIDCGAGIPPGSSVTSGGSIAAPGGLIVLPSGSVPLGLISTTGPAPGQVLPAPAGSTTGGPATGGPATGAVAPGGGQSRTGFAKTGANVVRLTLIGLVCVALGWQLTRLRRRGILS
jgi:hypothetical protein